MDGLPDRRMEIGITQAFTASQLAKNKVVMHSLKIHDTKNGGRGLGEWWGAPEDINEKHVCTRSYEACTYKL